jgi:uncharacterized RDD family membrane protein YckC
MSATRATVSISGLEELGLPPDLITGEAVVLELRPASFATRAMALAVDLFVQFLALLGLSFLLGLALTAMTAVDDAWGSAGFLVIFVTVLLVLPITVETLTRGRSLGKLAAGLRVVREDGGPIRFRQALVRGLVAVFETYLTGASVAVICSLADRRGRRVGDLLAGTYVIRERARTEHGPALVMPPMLAGWAKGADIGRIPDGLALAARQFHRRAAGLHPASRHRLGTELSAQFAHYVAPLPPAGVHPEDFLAAVLAERRERDLLRLRTEQAARTAREHRRAHASPLSAGGTSLVTDDASGPGVPSYPPGVPSSPYGTISPPPRA